MGKRNRERIARIQAGLEKPIAPPKPDPSEIAPIAFSLIKRLTQIGLIPGVSPAQRRR